MHIQEPEPVEFTLLDELISNLTLSDEESLGLFHDDDSDGYWTADEVPAAPPRLRTASLRGSNEPPRVPYHRFDVVQGRHLQVPPPLSPTISSVSSVTRTRANSSATVSSEGSVSASSETSFTLVDVYEPGRQSPDTSLSLSEMMTALSLSPQAGSSTLEDPVSQYDRVHPRNVPTARNGEGKTYQIGIHTANAWWRAADIASQTHVRPRKISNDRLRERARAAAARDHYDTEAEHVPASPPRPGRYDTAVTAGLDVGVFDDWLIAGPLVIGVSKAVFKSYKFRDDAQAAFNRTLERNAVRTFANRHEAAGVPLRRSRNVHIPRYARGKISPAHAEAIVVFRGREIGIFYDWLDCADHVLGIRGAVFNGFPTYEAAWNAWFDAVREDYPRVIHT